MSLGCCPRVAAGVCSNTGAPGPTDICCLGDCCCCGCCSSCGSCCCGCCGRCCGGCCCFGCCKPCCWTLSRISSFFARRTAFFCRNSAISSASLFGL